MTFLSGEEPVCSGQPSPIVGLTVNTNNACVFPIISTPRDLFILATISKCLKKYVGWGMHQVQIVPSKLLFAGHNN